ncbi:MAG TPA: oxalurate catabolism protein HpxZ [Acidimicrobiales bacterium]
MHEGGPDDVGGADGHPGVNLPGTVAELRAVFDRYEDALVANELDVLDVLFWPSPLTVRYGIADVQHGGEAVVAFRRALARQTAPRRLHDTVVQTFGPGFGVVATEFTLEDGTEGRQSQTWVRFTDGWRVVAAHVSIGPASTGADAHDP